MRYALLPILTLFLSTLAISSRTQPERVTPFTPYATPQERVQIGGGRFINVVCMGEGRPSVILSAGADGWSIDWIRVQSQIAKKTKVCAWDRAGHGFSSGSPEPQDTIHTEADLERALDGAGLTGPLVMVAHSLGAFETLRFADRHRDRVAGMVMVDPSTPDQEERLAEAAPTLMAFDAQSTSPWLNAIRRCVAALKKRDQGPPPDCAKLVSRYPEPVRSNLIIAARDPSYWEAFLSLFQSLSADSKQVLNAKRNYDDMPIVVLHAGLFNITGAPAEVEREIPAMRAESLAGQAAIARLSSRGTLVTVADSAHAIAGQKPSVVIDAVDNIVDDVRSGEVQLHK